MEARITWHKAICIIDSEGPYRLGDSRLQKRHGGYSDEIVYERKSINGGGCHKKLSTTMYFSYWFKTIFHRVCLRVYTVDDTCDNCG